MLGISSIFTGYLDVSLGVCIDGLGLGKVRLYKFLVEGHVGGSPYPQAK